MTTATETIRHKEQILEAIDQLRRRKARPDADRIYSALGRRHNVNYADAKLALERCVQNGCVLRVEYKGSTSYRNAAKKFAQLKREPLHFNVHQNNNHPSNNQGGGGGGGDGSKSKFAGLLTKAIADLVLQEPDYLQWGVPGEELLRNILSRDGGGRYTAKYVSILLDKEVQTGGLIRMESGNFLVGPAKEAAPQPRRAPDAAEAPRARRKPGPKPGFRRERDREARQQQHEVFDRNVTSMDRLADSGGKSPDEGKLRVGGRRKRAKKVFDPSDNHVPRKRGRPIGSLNRATIEKQLSKSSDTDSRPESRSSTTSHKEQSGVCSVCHGQNKKGVGDRLVACRECSNKAHACCLNNDDMMLKMYPDNTWQCPYCKTCVICYETADAGYLAVCTICADPYHLTCHRPQITEKLKPGAKWLCGNCQLTEQLSIKPVETDFENDDSKQAESPPPSSRSSRNSSPFRSPQPSPTPPTLSPQAHVNNRTASPSLSVKSDFSAKDLDGVGEDADAAPVDPSIPDPTHWTYDDVYNYFVRYFPDEAKAFLEHQIDGRSLLLMKRLDVLTGLKLKLGPALKIYRHVVKLQYRRDDPKLYWL